MTQWFTFLYINTVTWWYASDTLGMGNKPTAVIPSMQFMRFPHNGEYESTHGIQHFIYSLSQWFGWYMFFLSLTYEIEPKEAFCVIWNIALAYGIKVEF